MAARLGSGCGAGVLLAGLVAAGCAPPPPSTVEGDLLAGLPRYEEQRRALCARGRENAVTAVFCGDEPPALSSVRGLQHLLDLDLDGDERPGFTLLGHSTGIATRSVTALNPGSVIVSLPSHPSELNGAPGKIRTDGNIVALAYARGDQLAEIAVTPPSGETAFYLLRYERPCEGDCGIADRFSARTESGWTRWSLYDDEDLKNTALDCLSCHQPAGPSGPRIYRMQEPENPWTHWEAAFTVGGRALLDDTVAANGLDGVIAGIPGALVPETNPVVVEDLVRLAGSVQPNVFPAPTVEAEVQASDPVQPRDDTNPGESASWEPVYDAAVRGDAIPPPYHDVKVTDPARLAAATKGYIAFREGRSSTLPDPRGVFAAHALAGMSHRPKPGLDGQGILVHACAQCHNDRLDQSLTRARFDALHLDRMSTAERALAAERMKLPDDDARLMPPKLFRTLSPDERARAIRALQ